MKDTAQVYRQLCSKKPDKKLTRDELACALYEGTPHLQNLAEKLARQHGKAGALTFFDLMDDDVKDFWRRIADELIAHASEWEPNQGSCCVLSRREQDRLKHLPMPKAQP